MYMKKLALKHAYKAATLTLLLCCHTLKGFTNSESKRKR